MKSVVIRIKNLAASERKITAEILECICEIENQKIHFEMGYPSLLEFLVRECGYSETSALRRIDGAKMLKAIPEVSVNLRNGTLKLSQISMVAQSVRQKEKLGDKVTQETKVELLEAVKNKKTHETQQITSQILELPIILAEKSRVQSDESVRLEMSFTKEEMALLQKSKELLGHTHPGMSFKELFVTLAEKLVKEKDPAREARPKKNKPSKPGSASESILKNPAEKSLSAQMKRQVFQRDQGCCQWIDSRSGRICRSRHLIEVDHKIPRWAGGENNLDNLQLLCRSHNQLKYKIESGVRVAPRQNWTVKIMP